MTVEKCKKVVDAYCCGDCARCTFERVCDWVSNDVLSKDTGTIERLLEIALAPSASEKRILRLIAKTANELYDYTMSRNARRLRRHRIYGMMDAYTALTGIRICIDTDECVIYEKHSGAILYEWVVE